MKRKYCYIFFIIILFILTSCGKDGKDGDVYLKITLHYPVDSYWDNNPSIPYGFNQYTFYHCSPGTYSYEYSWYDSYGYEWIWYGTYELVVDKGEKGGFLVDGEDGNDKYYNFHCYSSGPFIDTDYSGKGNGKQLNYPQINPNNDEYILIEKSVGNTKMILEAFKKKSHRNGENKYLED